MIRPADNTELPPPSLEEIYDIDARRRRSRQRLTYGAVAAVTVVGVGFAGVTLASEPTITTEPAAPNEPPTVNEDSGTGSSTPTSIDPMSGWNEDDLDAYAAYLDAGYNHEQLLALAEEWNTSQFEAKGRAGNAIQNGDMAEITAIVGQPPTATPDGWNEDDLDAYAAYWDAGYNYEQLLALAEEWNASEFEAKGRAGNAIQNGDVAEITAIVGQPAEG